MLVAVVLAQQASPLREAMAAQARPRPLTTYRPVVVVVAAAAAIRRQEPLPMAAAAVLLARQQQQVGPQTLAVVVAVLVRQAARPAQAVPVSSL